MPRSRHEPSALLNTMACLVLMGKRHQEIADVCGVSREKVTRSLESPAGKEMLDRLRNEVQSQVFDPVQEQLNNYAREAMDELWKMREYVENERLKKDILVDVLHMAGYRPHTNTDRQAEKLPTIVIGQQNIQINDTSPQQDMSVEASFDTVPVDTPQGGAPLVIPKEVRDARETQHIPNESDGRSEHEQIRFNEVWRGDDEGSAKNSSRYERSTWRSQGSGRPDQSRQSSIRSGDAGEEHGGFEPSFSPE